MKVAELRAAFQALKGKQIQLDLTRGKPSAQQVSLADDLDGILEGNYMCEDGVDARNYGGLRGIPECREIGAILTDFPADNVIAAGNSSLTLMYLVTNIIVNHGLANSQPLGVSKRPKALCLVPGYDRHFTLTSALGVDMVSRKLGADGPDMDEIESLIRSDPAIAFVWCVPKHSNPTGCTYSEAVVKRMAALPTLRSDQEPFFVIWDNAYSVHDFQDSPAELASIYQAAESANTLDRVIAFASTSKITHAGAGVAFLAGSDRVLSDIEQHLSVMTVGHDKVNQLRHARFLMDADGIRSHMKKHADIVRPLFDEVERGLQSHLGNTDIASWTRPSGGYFVSLDVRPGLAAKTVSLAAELGLQLTNAGATYPYGKDPNDSNIRIAPTFATLPDVEMAMEALGIAIKLSDAEQA